MKLVISPDDVDHHADKSIRQWTYNALDCCVTHEVDSKLEPLLDERIFRTWRIVTRRRGQGHK